MINSIKNNPYYPQFLVFLQFGLIGLMLLFSKGFFSSFVGILVFFVGLSVGLWALKANRVGNFNIQPKLKDGSTLITSGIYAHVRHPMYTSVIVMMLGVFLSTPTLLESLFFLILIAVLWLKAEREEALWLGQDEKYEEYKKGTKLFLPNIL